MGNFLEGKKAHILWWMEGKAHVVWLMGERTDFDEYLVEAPVCQTYCCV
jgi:hypothetical protein